MSRRAAISRSSGPWRGETSTGGPAPVLLLPPLVFPLFFYMAFAGGLSTLGNLPGFDYYDYNAFQFVFVLLQSAAFGGVFIGFSIGADFDSGFTRRLFLSGP